MGSLAMALLAVALLGGPGDAPQAGPDLCLLMRGAGTGPVTPELSSVRDLLAAGDAAGAVGAFRDKATRLEAEAQKLFFDSEGSDPAPARAFMDGQVNGKDGLLAIRGDRFTLRPDVAAYGAFLSCRAGDGGFGLALLKSGWRDYAEPGFRTDAVFLMAALGKWDEAGGFLPENTAGERETLALGLLACHAGKATEGKASLVKALETLTDLSVRGVARQLLDGCGK